MLISTSFPILTDALALLCDALDLLDRGDAPGDIGAHVDLACERLRDVLSLEVQPEKSCFGPRAIGLITNSSVSETSSEMDVKVTL